jgi:hypothetical protein
MHKSHIELGDPALVLALNQAHIKGRKKHTKPERTGTMKTLSSLASAARKRAAYRRTLAELNGLPSKVKADLDIDEARACELARTAIYG